MNMTFSHYGAVLAIVASLVQPQALRLTWDRAYGSDTKWSEFRAVASVRNGPGIFVAVSERDALDPGEATAARLLLWRVDAAGALVTETEVKQSPTSKGTNTASIRDVAALDRDEALLLVEFEGGRPSIVNVNAAGRQTTTRELLRPGRTVTLFKIIPAPGGGGLLIGHESLDALMLQIDGAGNVLWEQKQDRGKMDFFVDGLAVGDGFVLVGNSGDYDRLRSGPSIVWVGRYDAKGVLQGEITFPGRSGRIARSRDGGYAVVYDRSSSTDLTIRLKRVDAGLKELSDTHIVDASGASGDFQIVGLPGGGFVIAGGQLGRSYVTTVDANGQSLATLNGPAEQRALDIGNYGLAYDGAQSVFLVSAHIEALSPDNVKRKLRIRRLGL